MPAAPLAYFLTFSTYGTRLHGDSRGTVDRHHNALGSPPLRRDDFRSGFEQRNMAAPQGKDMPGSEWLLRNRIEPEGPER